MILEGEMRRATTRFYDEDGALANPDAVSFIVTTPAGTTTEYVYGSDPEVVRPSTGVYYVDVDLSSAGTWWVYANATGEGQAAAEKSILVQAAHN